MKPLPPIILLSGQEYIDRLQASGSKNVLTSVDMNGLKYSIMLFGDEKTNTINIFARVASVYEIITPDGMLNIVTHDYDKKS